MTHTVLVVDDEAPARDRLRALLQARGDVQVVGEAGDGEAALHLVSSLKPDIVLLDVRMPGIDGLEAARHMALLDAPPAVIFTTAYDQYAVQAFEHEAVGYLLKPVRGERLAAALERATRPGSARLARVATQASPRPRSHIAVRLRDSIRLVPVTEIYYFTADQKYTTVRHLHGSDLIEESLRALEEEFAEGFVRIHRNALVSTVRIAAIERATDGLSHVVIRDLGEQLRVSRRLAGELRLRLRL